MRAMFDAVWSLIPHGTRLVAHSVTLETEALLSDLQQQHGGELMRIEISHAAPLGRYRSWEASRPVVQWSVGEMTVHFIGAGPGAPDLLTLRGRDLIASCPVCLYAGSLVPKEILAHCPPGARIVNTAPLSLDEIIDEIAAAHAAGQDVARLHSGDLSVWSAMGEQLRRLRELGIPFTVTPGVPSFAAAAAALEAELTLPGLAQSVVLTRTSGPRQRDAGGRDARRFCRDRRGARDPSLDACARQGHRRADAALWRRLSRRGGLARELARRADRARDARHARSRRSAPSWSAPRSSWSAARSSAQDFDESRLYAADYDRRYRPVGTEPAFSGGVVMARCLVISAPASGAGKTTLTLALARAFRDRGLAVQCFKSGPDYIDPAFHAAATGRASVNIDSWAMTARHHRAARRRAARDADLVLAEGSMGLFDGVATPGQSGTGASADLAEMMGWPVLLVLDPSGQAQTAAAVAAGLRDFRKGVRIAGVVLNRVASPRHEDLVRRAMEAAGIAVLGALPRHAPIALPERHLGLVQAEELARLDELIAEAARLVAERVDLDAVLRLAECAWTAPPTNAAPRVTPPGQRIALARDAAFSFIYPHMLEGWRAAGAEIMPFSPLADEGPDDERRCLLAARRLSGTACGADRGQWPLPRRAARPSRRRGPCMASAAATWCSARASPTPRARVMR